MVDPEQAASSAQLASRLQKAMADLPERQRAALVLCRFNGLSYDEIAETLDVGLPAVKSLVLRARRSLKESLRDML